jgi:hypothetical protein
MIAAAREFRKNPNDPEVAQRFEQAYGRLDGAIKKIQFLMGMKKNFSKVKFLPFVSTGEETNPDRSPAGKIENNLKALTATANIGLKKKKKFYPAKKIFFFHSGS